MPDTDLADRYRRYIDCLNGQDWQRLAAFVDDGVQYNGRIIGLSGYRRMLENDFAQIPDLRFTIRLLVVDPPYVASRLAFACSPKGEFLGLPVHGAFVSFDENVFYQFDKGRIVTVWSVIDKAAIEAQLSSGSSPMPE